MEAPIENQQPSQPTQPTWTRLRNRRGVALILVVSFIVLLSALVIGFFSRVSTDLAGARSYSEGVSVRQLADSAVGVVMGQIRSATTVTKGCWASQPGMIRVYGSGTQATSKAYAFYKLYSSNNLIVSDDNDLRQLQLDPTKGTGSGGIAEVPLGPNGWLRQPAHFTDVNEPVSVPDPTIGAGSAATIQRFPIFDPSVARIPALNQHTLGGDLTNWVEGCELNLPAGTDLQRVDANGKKTTYAPMPVRWLYLLKDGTLTAPKPLSGPATGTTGLKATWDTAGIGGSVTGVPTKENPIVGRIAFWTDDDTSKVNINTAGGFLLPDGVDEDKNLDNSKPSGNVPETNPAFIAGSFWDTPRIQTQFDRGFNAPPAPQSNLFRPGLANAQPVRNEFQRYPGHPSTTSLGIVFKHLLPPNTGFNSEKLYAMMPRLVPGLLNPNDRPQNSVGGTRQLVQYNAHLDKNAYGDIVDPASPQKYTYPNPDLKHTGDTTSYHLLASVDELLYSTLNGERKKTEDALHLNPNSITPKLIDQSRFFLTAHSRSPELNLFGRPRVNIWPLPSPTSAAKLLSANPPIKNPTDLLLQFCSTVGGNPDPKQQAFSRQGEFIFDRDDPYSTIADFRRPRNRNIFDYLHKMTSSSEGEIPGWGASFEKKYAQTPGGRDQILTEIFDYIRSVNLKDTSLDEQIDRQIQGTLNAQFRGYARYAPRGVVVPTRDTYKGNAVSGFGRFPTVSEVSLVFYVGGYISQPIHGGKETVEYDFRKLDRRRINTDVNAKAFFANNKLVAKLIRAFVIMETYNPMQGYGPVTNFLPGSATQERIIYEITKPVNFKIQPRNKDRTAVGPQLPVPLRIGRNNTYLSSGATWAGRNFGGTEGFFHTLQGKTSASPEVDPKGEMFDPRKYDLPGHPPPQSYYPFQTPCLNDTDGMRVDIVTTGQGVDAVEEDATQFDFLAGSVDMEIEIRYVDQKHSYADAKVPIQKLVLKWPSSTTPWPMPITEREANVKGEGFRQDLGGFDPTVIIPGNPPTSFDTSSAGTKSNWAALGGIKAAYSLPSRINWAQQHSHSPWPSKTPEGKAAAGDDKHYANRFLQILQPGDTIRSLVPGGNDPTATDPRVAHLQQTVSTLKPHPDYNKAYPDNVNRTRRTQTLRRGDGGFYFDPTNITWFGPLAAAEPNTGFLVKPPGGNTRYGGNSGPDLPKGITATRADGKPADFDTGIGNFPDGGFCGKADEGNLSRSWYEPLTDTWNYVEPYFSTWAYDPPGDTYFSPNRQIPSPVMFGSLLAPQNSDPSKNGWKTLLFCPNPAGDNHPADGFLHPPPDHLLLDLFNMPVVEPYAISEPFSTDGKVNLNYPIMPFGYIKRTTALRAALHSLRVTAVPQSFTKGKDWKYKMRIAPRPVIINGKNESRDLDNPENLRYLVDRDETLKAFDDFFDDYTTKNPSFGFFKSATEICDRYLYPKGSVLPANSKITWSKGENAIKTWWTNNALTGDNMREKPYSDLYPRVTTKSNTYTVHYRVQTLRQRPFTGNVNQAAAYYRTWDESRDQVLSEYRGHTTIERYLDPEDPRFQSTYTPVRDRIDVETQSLEDAYRFRVIYNKRFSPW